MNTMSSPVARSPPGSAGGSGNWEDRRSRNMQRNQQYLAQLFADVSTEELAAAAGSGPGGKPGALVLGDKSIEGASRVLQGKLRDVWSPRVESINDDDVIIECTAACPCREAQARRIVHYIAQSYHPLPPLLLWGPSGCGKSALTSRALAATDCFHVYVLCSAFASHGQLIRGAWMAFIKALIRRVACSQIRSPDVSAALLLLRPLEGKPLFSTFADALREVIEKFGISDVVFCFDSFDAVDKSEHNSIDSNIYVKLLNMTELVHESIRVIAIQRRPNRTSASAVVSSGSFAAAPPLLLKFPAYSDAELLKVVEAHAVLEFGENSSKLGIFSDCLKDSISQIRTATNHPEEIFNAARLIMQIKLDLQSSTATSGSSTDDYSSTCLIPTRTIADQVMRIPSFHPIGSALESVLDTVGTSAAASFGDSINNSLYGVNWISNMPIRTRYFLIAAYLASKNPKESDKFTFGDTKKGRRKRAREGADDDGGSALDGTAGGVAYMTHAPQSFALDRVLAIYRHIYASHEDMSAQAAAPSGGWRDSEAGRPVVPRDLDLDGGDGFFAMISTLEKRHWITASSAWRGDQPVYYFRADSDAIVNVVARSVHFPLQNYITAAVPVGLNA